LGGYILGIREIRNNEQIIYQDNLKAHYIGGALLLTLGIAALLVLIYADRGKQNALIPGSRTCLNISLQG
jgi:hypothetical protein